MCSVDDGERCDVYVRSRPRARREHVCTECGRIIRPGEFYSLARGLYEGCWNTYKTCAHCQVGQDWLLDVCNSFQHHNLLEEVREHADEIPESRFGLDRITVGIRRKWRRFSGEGLLPVPPMPHVPEAMRA